MGSGKSNRRLSVPETTAKGLLTPLTVSPWVAVMTTSLPGCPINKQEFLAVVKDLLAGKTPKLPDYPVCVECKLRENVCMYHKGQICLGVIARAGCNAHCPTFGGRCVACRGLIDQPNNQAAKDVMDEHGVTLERVLAEFRLYNGWNAMAEPPSTDAKQESMIMAAKR